MISAFFTKKWKMKVKILNKTTRELFDFTDEEIERTISALDQHANAIKNKTSNLQGDLKTTRECIKFWVKLREVKRQAENKNIIEMVRLLASETKE